MFFLWLGELKARCFFGIEHRSQGEGEAMTLKQQPQRASALGTGADASLASPLSRSKACSHSYYTRNGYVAITTGLHQAWHSGYYEGSTTRAGKFYTSSYVCIKR